LSAEPLEPEGGPWRRRDTTSLVLLLVFCAGTLPWLLYEHFLWNVDAGLYILTSKALLAGEGYAYLGEPFVLRPPGLPVLLAPVLALFGTDFAALNLATNAMGIAAVLLLFLYARPALGAGSSALLAAVTWLHPVFREVCNSTLSDAPGAALLFGGLLAERRLWSRRSLGSALGLGLLVAGGVYVRSLLVFLLPAFALSWLWRRGFRGERPLRPVHAAVALGLPLLLLAPWWLRNAAVPLPRPALETAMASQDTAMWHRDKADPDSPRLGWTEVGARVPPNAARLAAELASGLAEPALEEGAEEAPGAVSDGRARIALGALLVVLVILGAWRSRSPALLFFLANLAILSVWHTARLRLVLPAYLIGLPVLAALVTRVVARWSSPVVGRGLTAVLLVALGVTHGLRAPDWNRNTTTQLQRESLCRDLESLELDPQGGFASEWGWNDALYLDRPVRAFRHRVHRQGATVGDLRELGVRYVIAPHPSRQYAALAAELEARATLLAQRGRLRAYDLGP